MTGMPRWEYSGAIELTGDLSVLESELHAGRVTAVEEGYQHEPDSIEISTAMLVPGGHLLAEEEAAEAGLEFTPTHTRYLMVWNAES